jgi:hypothetical protein
MELIILAFLYLLSKDPDFSKAVKPILSGIKNSEDLLKFVGDISKFSSMFTSSAKQPEPPQPPKAEEKKTDEPPKDKEKTSKSPTEGIADAFIQQCLENYFKNR